MHWRGSSQGARCSETCRSAVRPPWVRVSHRGRFSKTLRRVRLTLRFLTRRPRQRGCRLCADFVVKVALTSDRWPDDKILFGVASPPGNPGSLSKPGWNHFLTSLAWTSSKILLQHNLPIPDLPRRHYWRTCVARPNIETGIVTLSALAVWRFAPSSKSLGLLIGRSPGLAPLRI